MLQRQAGVEKATYSRDGVIEMEADAEAPFEVKKILSLLKDEMGFDPIKEIEVTVVGRVNSTSKEWTIKPKNSEDVFLLAKNEQFKKLRASEGIQNQEITLTGKLHKREDGVFVLAVDRFQVNLSTP
jgi:hypothetical protein